MGPPHFLIGRPLTAIPDPDLRDLKENWLDRFQRLQRYLQDIWARWSKENIGELQQRQKWKEMGPQVTKDISVLIKDNNLPPFSWKLGRVIDTHPGEDGIMRVVSVQTPLGILRRAVSSICPLPINRS
ncbi:hypothetical protein JTB14_015753 [Gonioctena quinquepunctata]|nr:hypothetical protein JTB14_015753 [Gonioctena quinquepunctata]